MTPTVRRAGEADAAHVSDIVAEVLGEGVPVAIDGPMTPAEVRAWLDRLGDRGAMFALGDGGRILAFAVVEPL